MFATQMPLKATLITILLISLIEAGEKIYVFYPSITRPHIAQQELQNALKGVDVFVFGRYSDFVSQVQALPPSAIITKDPLDEQFRNYHKRLSGCRGNKRSETYVLISLGKTIDTAAINSKTVVGIVDFMGRKNIEKFASTLVHKNINVKCVLKPEDLITLLVFEMVDYVLIEESYFSYYRKIYDLDFKVSSIRFESSGIISVSVQKGKSAEKLITKLRSLKELNAHIFGIDEWM